MARVESPNEIRARHSYLGRELLHAHRSNDFGKGDLKRNALVDRSQEELASEFSIPKILTAQSYTVETERACPGFPPKGGDPIVHFAMEMKWTKKRTIPKVKDDIEKLQKYRDEYQDAECLLCIFGVMSVLKGLKIPDGLTELREAVYADLKRTRFGCRIFRLTA